jgi:LemA protein
MKMHNLVFVALLAGTSMTMGCDLADKGVVKYDTLVDKDEACSAAWGDYESNLTRRAQMVPQLVAIVKAASAHEEVTLTAIAQAQANATRPEIKLDPKAGDLEDPAKFAAYQQAQSSLGTQLSRLMVQAPAQYPNLAAMGQFHDLQVQIEGTENRLLRAREQYNKAVLSFNTELRHVSGKVMNPLTGHEFKPKAYFQADESDKAAPKIDFGAPAVATAVTPATSK